GQPANVEKYGFNSPTAGQGITFAQQWLRVMDQNPPIVMITGWNEWTAGKWDLNNWNGQDFVNTYTINTSNQTLKWCFVDCFNAEYSRDIEPMRGSLGDNYYCQMVSQIRQYKGTNALSAALGQKTVDIDGNLSQWDLVGPLFLDTIKDTATRNSSGTAGGVKYQNFTGRNDLDTAKVSMDGSYAYFYMSAMDDITPAVGTNWMNLFINTNMTRASGWEGFDFVINRYQSDGKCSIEANIGGIWDWNTVGWADYTVTENIIQIKIPLELLGITREDNFDFKWADNSVADGDIMDFYDKGDAAPDDRFNFRYIAGSIVDSVTITTPTISLDLGQTFKFDAIVNGTGAPLQNVTWIVEGGVPGTFISEDGELTIAANETAVELTVKAISQQETYTHIFGTATVTVIPVVIGADPFAYVDVHPGNINDLTITIVEQLSNGRTNEITETFSIDNNAAAIYELGDYLVYVDTKGNDQIRECMIVEADWEPSPDPAS
ncbi:MAG: hypothetical protein FWH48_08465, partial [Oscillospiraceae bacterium]|nr:hypothetical protein [Oscillospiraceae bacterium]